MNLLMSLLGLFVWARRTLWVEVSSRLIVGSVSEQTILWPLRCPAIRFVSCSIDSRRDRSVVLTLMVVCSLRIGPLFLVRSLRIWTCIGRFNAWKNLVPVRQSGIGTMIFDP